MASLAATLLRAAQFAAECHSGQRRKGAGSEPYVNHVIEVAAILAEVQGDTDPNLLVAALLHDSIEDAGVTREKIAAQFNEDVADLVGLVTDDKSLEKKVRKQLQIETAAHKPKRAQWLKIADKTSNLRAIRDSPPKDWSMDRCREYLTWARRVVEAFPEPHPVLLAQFHEVAADLEARLPRG